MISSSAFRFRESWRRRVNENLFLTKTPWTQPREAATRAAPRPQQNTIGYDPCSVSETVVSSVPRCVYIHMSLFPL